MPLLHPLGDHPCTWHVPDDTGTLVSVPGTLRLGSGERPAGDMHGTDLPWDESLWPAHRTYSSLTATLAGGASVYVTDVGIEALLPGQALLQAGVAVVSIGHFPAGVEPLADEIEMQIESLDVLSGLQPLIPDSVFGRSWSAENADVKLTWSEHGLEATLDYMLASTGNNPYTLRVSASPRLTLRAKTPMALSTWVREWVQPLQQVCSLAAGRRCRVTYVILRSKSPTGEQYSQLYANGIVQESYESEYRRMFDTPASVNLEADGVSLLGLTRGWRAAEDAQHPLVETYGAMLLVDEHPRSRYLLLLQALEGAYGYEQRSSFAARLAKHEADVKVLLAKLKPHTNAKERKKIKSGLKMHHPGLDGALTHTLESLPYDLRPGLAGTALVKQVIADTDNEADSPESALRVVRNDLAHGNRSYPTNELRSVVALLERVVRAEGLRMLGCSTPALERALKASRP